MPSHAPARTIRAVDVRKRHARLLKDLRHLNLAQDRRWDEYSEEIEALEKRLKAKLADEFDGQIKTVANEIREIQPQVDALIVSEGANKSPWHEGTRFEEWSKPWLADKYEKTGRVGVVEIWNRESKRPAGQRYGLPSVGDIVLRVLDVKGKPCSRFVRRGWYEDSSTHFTHGWLIQGMKPKKKGGTA